MPAAPVLSPPLRTTVPRAAVPASGVASGPHAGGSPSGPADSASALAAFAALGLKVQAAMLSAGDLASAAEAGVRELARGLPAEQVWIAYGPGLTLRLLAASDGRIDDPALRARREAACAEAADQAAVVALPVPPAAARSIPRIHRALRRAVGSADWGVALPLVSDGRVVGALCLRGRGQPHLPAATREALEHLVAPMGPLLELLREREQTWLQRLRHVGQSPGSAGGRAAGRLSPWALRRWGGVLAVGLLVALLWPVGLPVGGHARLEGAVQRLLAAPADGFVQQVLARPGESVTAGQTLLTLADQDLQIERERWQSQLAQYADALAAAQARADRAELVQVRSRADEARAQLALVEGRLQRSRVVAPFDGVVVQGDLSRSLGAPVRQGDELMTVATRDAHRVIVEVDERDIGLVRLGQTGALALSALPWQTLAVQVTRIDPVARAVDGRNVFEVEAALSAPPDGLRPGLLGTAQIEVGEAGLLWRWSRRLVERARLQWWRWFG